MSRREIAPNVAARSMYRAYMVGAVLILACFGASVGCSDRGSPEPAVPKFTELSSQDAARLEQQRAVVANAARQRYGTVGFTKTKDDLPILQRLIDDKAFSAVQTYELQSLGVAFGDVLASELPLHWVVVTDEFGTNPTLRFKDTTLQINALTMISKRIERGEAVNLSDLLRVTREHLAAYGPLAS